MFLYSCLVAIIIAYNNYYIGTTYDPRRVSTPSPSWLYKSFAQNNGTVLVRNFIIQSLKHHHVFKESLYILYAYASYCRHADQSSRPSFAGLISKLSLPENELLGWTEQDIQATHPRAIILGATAEAASNLHSDLQRAYTTCDLDSSLSYLSTK